MPETPTTETANRRPLKSRGAGWAKAIADVMAQAEVDPNLVSAMSIAFAGLGGALMLVAAGQQFAPLRSFLFLAAAGAIQLRLLCNLLDGMVAVEHGLGDSAGPIWNELPDRVADVIFLASAGYAAASAGMFFGAELGWICAMLALLTAYVRELGRGLSFPADFSGPMAKPHRMAALTVTCGASALEPLWGWRGESLMVGLAVIGLGTAYTVYRRTHTLARRLAERAGNGDPP